MIKKLITYLNKYHQANLWLDAAYVREAKKQELHKDVVPVTPYDYMTYLYQRPQVVFTQPDAGHNEEEKIKIQQLYQELGSVFNPQRLAI
ncbi:MAG TPA: hypothetical protein VLF20_06000 [Patescibacteria group bacterium]|nr:hypothetical protein [Patescibacteria group bacterium]